VPFLSIALEAQMTHNLIHLDHPVQKAGQTGTALPIQPLPRNFGVRRLAAFFTNARPYRKSINESKAPASNQFNPQCDSDFRAGRPRVAQAASLEEQPQAIRQAPPRLPLFATVFSPPSAAPRATARLLGVVVYEERPIFLAARLFSLSGAKGRGGPFPGRFPGPEFASKGNHA
jgi:hypothetical protein